MDEAEDKVRENRLRRQAKRLGFLLNRSRARMVHLHDQGMYRIVNPETNGVVRGENFEYTLDDVAEFLDDWERQLRELRSQARAESSRRKEQAQG